ncbi:MAG: hypothetical protein OK404_02500 [Thaumarchaeota archaeon]|nr:hypothetical protein [Nitrososphaerota archaeon]
MKLTSFGRDFHITILVLVASGAGTGEGIFVALALALAFSSLVSLGLLRLRARAGVRVEAEDRSLRVFKKDHASTELRMFGSADRWVSVSVDSARFEGPVEVEVDRMSEGRFELKVTPLAAGRYAGLILSLRLTDVLKLFSASILEKRVDLVIDSLPMSLLAPVRSPVISPLVLGENPAGRPGRGQEFYGVEEYSYRTESRDIMWKRAARRPESPLLARVREANIPEFIRVKVRREDQDGEKTKSTDLLCEALATLGRTVLMMGVDTEFLAPDGQTFTVGDDEELADAIMAISAVSASVHEADHAASGTDITVLVGGSAWDDLGLDAGGPLVLIGEGPVTARGRFVFFYSGVEDMTQAVGLVISR